MMNRRHFLLSGLGSVLLARAASAAHPRILVFKSPTCGCCSAWNKHMVEAGFSLEARDVDQDQLWATKATAGITPELASCHTAFVEGYFIEGHVPASDVKRLLRERPQALGLTVPGMPIGSPGMEMGDQKDAYATLLIRRTGDVQVFQRHN